MQVIKVDENGFYIELVVLSEENITSNHIKTPLPLGLYKPKWTGAKWVEGKTEEEFLEDAFLSSLNPSVQDLEKAERELEIIELLIEMGLI